MSVKSDDKKYIANTYARFPVQIVRGSGSLAYDENGKEYIDLGSGIAVNIFGFSDKFWIDAVTELLNTFQHTSNLYYTSPCVTLAKILCERTGMQRVFFCNSGAEANECAIKAARRYAELSGRKNSKIITLVNSFHGRTITTLAATGQDSFHNDFLPLTDGFLYTPANDIESFKKLVQQNDVSAVMFECVQGEGGVLPLDKDYVLQLEKTARENDILLIVDEVQTGNGRTGKLYSYMNFGICPDIVTTAKGLGGGLPVGAVLMGEKCENTLGAGMHGSTFGGNPVVCAGGVYILSRIDEKLLQEVREKGEFVKARLQGVKGVKSVSGLGLMLGIELEEKSAADVMKACIARGVIPLTAKEKVRLLPPLVITREQLERALDVLADVIAE